MGLEDVLLGLREPTGMTLSLSNRSQLKQE